VSGLTYKIDDAELQEKVGEISNRIQNRKKAMEAIGVLARESVRTNFEVGGRPNKWPAPKRRDGQPLLDTGKLKNSIGKQVDGDTVYVGTNVVYAAVHHFGAKKGSFGSFAVKVDAHQRIVKEAFGKELKFPVAATVKGHTRNVKLPWGNIPARPFMLLQQEDLGDINELLSNWIMEGKL